MTTCPCCKHSVSAPDLPEVVARYGLTPMETAVLDAVWKGCGLPVTSERIFDAMYADDPDGGPSPSKMYSDLRATLRSTRQKLEGSGVAIKEAGYRRGFRLGLGG